MKVKDNIYYVGVLNPNLRIFDIIMKTEYGTSYNAYVVKGEKTVLIESVHETFSDYWLDQVKTFTDISDIDFIILNHTEPDHSGSLKKLLDLNPDITVIASAAGIKNLQSITNRSFKHRVVKTGDTLDIGAGMVFSFLIAPNLHWPDSMFTYLAARKTVFTCDFLGSHYCEVQLTDDKIVYRTAYEQSFQAYYNAIFGPFKPYVQKGLEILKNLDFDCVCTSHGPVLKEGIKTCMGLYESWSAAKVDSERVSIFYVSAYGYTKKMAQYLQEALVELGLKADLYHVLDVPEAQLVEAAEGSAGLLFGSPTINRDALKPIMDLISSLDAIGNKGKPAMVFGSYGWSGEAFDIIRKRLEGKKLRVVGEDLKCLFRPTEQDAVRIKEAAKEFSAQLLSADR